MAKYERSTLADLVKIAQIKFTALHHKALLAGSPSNQLSKGRLLVASLSALYQTHAASFRFIDPDDGLIEAVQSLSTMTYPDAIEHLQRCLTHFNHYIPKKEYRHVV